ncbi:MAG: transglutaminase-like domain-containing protein [bacterium]|nr:transglutaminase-like domain-containing protein [bacterium]
MIKSSCKNGITVEKDIELVMKNTGFTPWYYYLLQFLFLSILCSSIAFCFFSGLEISVADGMVVLVLGLFVALFMILFSYRSVLKYTGLITLFLYVMFGYINLERLQEGSAQIYNSFIELYNAYFNGDYAKIIVSHSDYKETEQFFVLFMMFLIVAVVCYTAMFGKTMFFYIITTIPAVFLCFIVGYTPELWSYILYITGTVALFSSVISERYGLFSKINRRRQGSLTIMILEKTRIKIQMICAVILFGLMCILYIFYSPERYEKEFDAKQVRTDLQDKIRSLTSSDLLKDTFFNKIAEITEEHGNSGLSNGRLGTIGKITYANKTALLVKTDETNTQGFYLKGYVGERYDGNRWTTLTKADQREVKKLNNSLISISDVEQLSSQFSAVYDSSMYRYYPLQTFSLEIENKSADTSCDYVPYTSVLGYTLENGKVMTGNSSYQYYRYDIPVIESGLTYEEMFYKYCKFTSILQLNTLNTSILNKYLGYNVNSDTMEQTMTDLDSKGEPGNSYHLSDFDKSINDDDDMNVGLFSINGSDTDTSLGGMVYLSDYAADENAYYNLVKDIYTKLPDRGLDRVKDLVKDKKIDLSVVDTKHTAYKTMDEVDSTAYARKVYEIFSDHQGIDTEELLSSSFTYDQRTKQDEIFDAISYVKDYLAQNTSYTLSPGKTPSGEDYVEYFLFTSKKGYCMHYASAATVMLRAMGVPARYCEGYVVTENDLANAKKVNDASFSDPITQFNGGTEYIEADIKDTNAHAWVEVYLPGYGWTPIEMTAPYSNGGILEIPPVNQDPKATLKPTVRPTATSDNSSSKPSPTATQKASSDPKATASPGGSVGQRDQGISIMSKISSWYDGLSATIKRVIKVSVSIVIFLCLTIVIILLRRMILLELHKRRLTSLNANQSILYEYSLLSRHTARRLSAYTTDSSYEAYADRFVEKYPFMEKQDAITYFAILLKAKFAMGEMTEQEVDKVMEFNSQFIRYEYNSASRLKQIYYKYIFVIR